MKYIILNLIFIATFNLAAQKKHGTIYFKDGTKKVGYVSYGPNLTSPNASITDKVLYRTNKKDKNPIEYDYSEISKFEYSFSENKLIYYFKIPKDNPNTVLDVTLLHEGSIKLFRYSSLVDSPMPNGGINTHYSHQYYVQKDEEYIHRIYPNKFMGPSSQRLMKEYFSDCPKLVELITREAFKRYVTNSPELRKNSTENRLLEIVKYYDSKCFVKE